MQSLSVGLLAALWLTAVPARPDVQSLLQQATQQDDPKERGATLAKALTAAKRAKDPAAEGACLEAQGDLLHEQGEAEPALVAYELAESAFVRAGDRKAAGLVALKQLDALAGSDHLTAIMKLERLLAAERYFDSVDPILAAETAAAILRETEDRVVAMSAQIRGARHFFFGYIEGEAASMAYAALRNATDLQRWDARFWGESAYTYLELADAVDKGTYAAQLVALSAYAGDVEAAERWAGGVREGRAAEEDVSKRASLLNNLGFAYAQTGQLEKARDLYEQSLALRKGAARIRVLENLASLALKAGDCGRAQKLVAEAITAGKQEEEIDTTPLLHLVLAGCKRRAGELKGAREELDAAGMLVLDLLDSPNRVFRELAAELVSELVPAEALEEQFNNAERLQLAAGHKGAELAIGEPGPAARTLVSRHLAKGDLDSALSLIEMNKARKVLFAGMDDFATLLSKASPRERLARAQLAEQLSLRQNALLSLAEPRPAERFETLIHREAAANMLAAFDAALRLKYPPPQGADESPAFQAFDRRRVSLEKLSARLPEGVAFLELGQAVDKAGTRLVGLVVRKDKPAAFFDVRGGSGRGAEELRQRVEELAASFGDVRVRGVRRPPPPKEGSTAGQELYAALIEPARPYLEGARHLIISPDGPVMGLSFASLPVGEGRFLADELSVSYALSAGALLMQLERADTLGKLALRTAPGVVVANPDYGDLTRLGRRGEEAKKERFLPNLPGAQAEGVLLRKALPKATILSGGKATEEAFRSAAANARMLHFATHGLVDDARGELSALVLAAPGRGSKDDGLLTAREIASMSLRAQLAVLSACSTAQGTFRDGEGTIGLGWAFARAGVPSVVVTQWPVNDSATALFMKAFYAALSAGASKAAAMGSAVKAVRSDPRFAHPRFWAAFELVGDWR